MDKTAAEYREDCRELAGHLNELSEALLGYREGTLLDMITRVNHLKAKSQNVEIKNQFREIADAVSELNSLVEDVISDA